MSTPPEPIKASIIEPVGCHGGMNPYDFNLCHGLSTCGVAAALFTSDLTTAPGEPLDAREVYQGAFGRDPVWLRAFRYVRGTFAALAASVSEGRRICHFHFFRVGLLELMNVTLARLLLRKVIITAHDVESFAKDEAVPGLPRFVYGMAHAVIAHNQISRQELLHKVGLPDHKIHVIPAGNHLAALSSLPSPEQARQALGLAAAGPFILFFGQIKEVKGLDLLLEAMPAILAAHPGATLVIAGRPWKMDFSSYQQQIERLGIGSHCVTHIRFIESAELPLYFQASDLIALPYRRIYQSDVALMAMSYGKAVVTSDIPGMTELIEDGCTGFTFCSGEPASLSATINKALASRELRDAVAERGQQLMSNNYSWSSICTTTAGVYRSCL